MPRALISILGEDGHLFNMAKTINASFVISVLFHKQGEGRAVLIRGEALKILIIYILTILTILNV